MTPLPTAPTTGIKRRQFLKTAGWCAAGPLILTHRLRAAPTPGNRITLGFIGTGRQALDKNLPEFLALQDVQVVALCDVDSWRLGEAKKLVDSHYAGQSRSGNYQGCAIHKDFRELLARPDLDAVMISTPDHWHVPMAAAALRAGKDVALEKPITRRISEGRLLADLVARHQRVFRVDSEFRSLASYQRAAELVRNGRIGRILTIRTGSAEELFPDEPEDITPVPPELDYDLWLGPAPLVPYIQKRVHTPHDLKKRPGWMRNQDYTDGMICNWGAHLNDIAQWGNNTERTGPVSVQASGRFHPGKVWNVLESFEAFYQFANGVTLKYQMGNPGVRFEGEHGWIEAAGYPGILTASDPKILTEKIGAGEIHLPLKSEKRDFIDAVKTRVQPLEDAEVGQRTTSLCHLAHISIQRGGSKLAWDPAKEQFPDDAAANQLMAAPSARAPW